MLGEPSVVIQITGLKKFASAVRNDPALSAKVTKKWEARYRGFILKRFAVFSRGGGDWAPLAPSTIEGRRKGGGKGTPAILRDTSTMYNALMPNFQGPGAFTKHGKFEVTIGYGGSGKHASGGSASVADIASFHQSGGPNLPKRMIIVPPDKLVIESMQKDAVYELNKKAKEDIG